MWCTTAFHAECSREVYQGFKHNLKLFQRMHRKLINGSLTTKIEISVYFCLWITAIIYSIYRFSSSSYFFFQKYNDLYGDFEKGVTFLSPKRDKADFEWETILYFLENIYPWGILHVFITEISIKYNFSSKVLKLLQILFTSVFLIFREGPLLFALLLLQPVIFYLTHHMNPKKVFKWICSISSLGLIVLYKWKLTSPVQKLAKINDYELYLFTLSLSWMNLKCTSFYLEVKTGRFIDFFNYCLYFPTIFTGPFILHEDFMNKYKISTSISTKLRMLNFIRNVSITIFWFIFEMVMLHYVYVNAAIFQPSQLVEKLDNWSLYGFGYAMGQHFHIKYIVIYGLSTSLASFENVIVPHLPRCIGRIHLYSDMWKYFDAGLYKFLVRHIYIPVVKVTSHKLLASMTTFAFVYIWHGTALYILIWCILNYIGIVIEQTCSSLFSVNKPDMNKSYSDSSRRTKCFFGALLLAVSAISNFYFFGGKQIGDLFFQRVFTDSLFNTVILVIILYCGAQVSTELRSMHARKCDNNSIK